MPQLQEAVLGPTEARWTELKCPRAAATLSSKERLSGREDLRFRSVARYLDHSSFATSTRTAQRSNARLAMGRFSQALPLPWELGASDRLGAVLRFKAPLGAGAFQRPQPPPDAGAVFCRSTTVAKFAVAVGTMRPRETRMGSFPRLGNAMRYVAYAVDLAGVARAAYELDCPTDKDAEATAKKFLEAHPTVEVWEGPRRVARLVRENSD